MSDTFELVAEKREDVGKGASRRLRRLADKIPAIIYGASKEPESIMIEHRLVLKALENEAFYSHILTLDVAGKKQKAVLKDIQRHASKPKVLHMDFQRVSAKEKLHMNIPLHFIGEEDAPGVKEGGVVSHLMTEVEVKCLPKDLPEFIEVDVSELALDASLHLSDITAPKGVEFLALSGEVHDLSVASIHVPRAALTDDELDAADAAEDAAAAEAAAAAAAEEDNSDEEKK